MAHIPVLLAETLEALAIAPDGIYVDATFGAGGHARAVLERLSPHGRLIAFDADPEARARVWDDARLTLVPENFRTLADALDELAIPLVDGVYYDLGVSSMQFDDAERGFSFRADAPLDMRLDPTRGASAAELIAETDETELADIIYKYGEERASRRIARALVARKPTTTLELAGIVAGVVHVRGKRERTHPATRTFQALRIAVNDELDALEASLEAAMSRTREGGRIAVIAFHSLEDRIVKTRFRDDARVRPVVRKPIVAGADELASNPRSRSAKLRAAERIT